MITTNGPVGLAPAFAAFHDGGFDIFDTGGTATAGLEALAEVGDFAPIVGEASDAGYNNTAGFAPGGPFVPNGGTGSIVFAVDSGQTSFSIAAMVLPSNDWFIGTGDAVEISSLINAAPGATISFELFNVYDAGTEAEDFSFSPGNGLVGITTVANPVGGSTTSDPIALVTGSDPFAAFANLEPNTFDTSTIDFTGGSIATVTLTVVPEPTTAGLIGLGCLGTFARRRRC
jgi:hypothetical protein